MSTSLWGVILPAVVTAVVGVVVMESYQTTPWLADKLMQWSVRLRYADNPERGKVRGEELLSLLEGLPTLFKLPTAGGFLLRALAYHLASRRGHARHEPPAVQRSLGARLRIALAKAGLFVVCTGTVFVIESALVIRVASTGIGEDFITSLPFSVAAGILAAIQSAIRPSRFYHKLIGGTAFTLFVATFGTMASAPLWELVPAALLGGIAFGVATALTYALTVKFKYVGVVIGASTNLTGFALTILADSPGMNPLWVAPAVAFIGIGLAVGVLAGFAAVVERAHREKYDRGGSLVMQGI